MKKKDDNTLLKINNVKNLIKENNFFELDSSKKVELIISTNNVKYIKQCINNREKLKLGSSCVIKLIIATNDIKYIKQCVRNREELRLAPYHFTQLIIATNDVKYIKKCIENSEQLKINSSYLSKLILATKDKNYISECIENYLNSDSLVSTDLIMAIKDKDYIKQCIIAGDKLGFKSNDIVCLIKSINDSDYIKKCIESRKKIGLDSNGISKLIISTNDSKYIKQCIEDRKQLGIKTEDIIKIIISLSDVDYIKYCIRKRKKLGFNLSDVIALIIFTRDFDYIEKNLKKYKLEFYKEKIIFPDEITIGIEIETVGQFSKQIKELLVKSEIWQSKGDETVQGDYSGESDLETISPILKGLNKNTIEEINIVVNTLKKLGQRVNDSCGAHIHIGFNYLKSKQALLNLLELWCNMEYILYIIGNDVGFIPRGIEYASPISRSVEKALKNHTINLSISQNFENIKQEIIKVQGTKGKAINFMNIDQKEKNTIEFRSPNGTLNSNVWVQNIVLFGNLVKVSQDLAYIQEKNIDERTKKEKLQIEYFNKLKHSKIKGKQKLELFLNLLLLNKKTQKIYIDRYNENIKLLKKRKHLNNLIKSRISKNNIVIN